LAAISGINCFIERGRKPMYQHQFYNKLIVSRDKQQIPELNRIMIIPKELNELPL